MHNILPYLRHTAFLFDLLQFTTLKRIQKHFIGPYRSGQNKSAPRKMELFYNFPQAYPHKM